MAGNPLPPQVAPIVGHCLKQARTARGLTIAQAANQVGISTFQLQEFENGQGSLSDLQAQFIIGVYGGVRGDRLDSILYSWAMSRLECEHKTKRRAHLSIVGDDPKPWEKRDVQSPRAESRLK